jgi:hypothetical protein
VGGEGERGSTDIALEPLRCEQLLQLRLQVRHHKILQNTHELQTAVEDLGLGAGEVLFNGFQVIFHLVIDVVDLGLSDTCDT